MCAFQTTINYSSCNEDWRSEALALKITEEDTVLCITGSGDRVMHTMQMSPRQIVAIDANRQQNYLLELKLAALKKFSYEKYIAFLGLRFSGSRQDNVLDLLGFMGAEAGDFWLSQKKIIKKGVLYCGRFEKFYNKISIASRVIRFFSIRKLFSFTRVEEQREFVKNRWDRLWWRYIYVILCSRFFLRLFLRDPAFYRFVNVKGNTGNYLYDTMLSILKKYPARENFMLSLVFRGELSDHDLPPYLKEDASQKIKMSKSIIEIQSLNIISFLQSASENRFTKFSLSDVPSYLSRSEFEHLLIQVVRTAKNGARICIRFFLAHYDIPEQLVENIIREPGLENELMEMDRAFAYRFLVATIFK